ncbi:YdcF family protein [Sutcliffiella horikoshii]|uniref:YdcF family protein n=1 Tax=Sutcliffiella horikoshii TaxID=79883 RepID=UPI001F2FD7AC|nr:YdcF family protein [Sutcliffiella horikoshii]MCG1020408.1 YdcF family protein [Sutcliffiella horikoshii]
MITKKRLKTITKITLVPLIIYLIIVHSLIYQSAKQEPPEEVDYLIVLGARVKGEMMTKALLFRVEAALEYLRENPNTKVIASGGQGPGEDITEAEAMRRYFVANGIDEDRILLEDRSTTTFENLSFSRELIGEDASVAIVSNDFHVYRASIIGKRLDFAEVHTLAGRTPTIAIFKLWSREYFAVAKTWLVDK